MTTRECLVLNGCAPSEVHRDDAVGASQIQADTSGGQRHQQNLALLALLQHADRLISTVAIHVALVPDREEIVLGEEIVHNVKSGRERADDDDLLIWEPVERSKSNAGS